MALITSDCAAFADKLHGHFSRQSEFCFFGSSILLAYDAGKQAMQLQPFFYLTIATHGPCWGLHTERHAPPFLTLFDVFAFSFKVVVLLDFPMIPTKMRNFV